MPYKSSSSFTVSTNEWMPSLTIAELPVTAAAANLVSATPRFPANAATTTFVLDVSMFDTVCWVAQDERGTQVQYGMTDCLAQFTLRAVPRVRIHRRRRSI